MGIRINSNRTTPNVGRYAVRKRKTASYSRYNTTTSSNPTTNYTTTTQNSVQNSQTAQAGFWATILNSASKYLNMNTTDKENPATSNQTTNDNTLSEAQIQQIKNTIGDNNYNNLTLCGFTFNADASGNITATDSEGNIYTLDEIKIANDESIEGDAEINIILGGEDKNEMTTEACEAFITKNLTEQGLNLTDDEKAMIKYCSMKSIDTDGNGTVTRQELKDNLEKAMTQLESMLSSESTPESTRKKTEKTNLKDANTNDDDKISKK
jgi:hypothetical protein